MKKLFFVFYIVMTTFCTIGLYAQSIGWSVKPGVYDKIEPLSGEMYMIYTHGGIGIINGDGSEVVHPSASRITGFYGGLALVLKSEGGKERILGILSTDGSYSKVSGTYFTIPYQEFFSEGMLTVCNSRGQAGYMNSNGIVVKSFDVSFVSPFSEGFAVVGENEDYRLVDKRFNTISIQLGTVAQLYGGSNVYRGAAILWDGNGKFYNYDVRSGTCRKITEPRSLDYDYMYCFSEITRRPATVPYEKPERGVETISIVSQGGLYGYSAHGKIILPCQFDEAENFYGSYAVAKLKGSYGILKSLQNSQGDFNATATKSDIRYRRSASRNLEHGFSITLPSGLYGGDDITVRLKDDNGNPINITGKGSSYRFLADGGNGKRKYMVEIEDNGLKLWSGTIVYDYAIESEPIVITEESSGKSSLPSRMKPFTISLKLVNDRANKDNRCYVKATINNPNSEAITASVTIKGSNLLESTSQRVSVPAHGSKEVTTFFTVKKASPGQKVTASTTAGGHASLDNLQLIPF